MLRDNNEDTAIRRALSTAPESARLAVMLRERTTARGVGRDVLAVGPMRAAEVTAMGRLEMLSQYDGRPAPTLDDHVGRQPSVKGSSVYSPTVDSTPTRPLSLRRRQPLRVGHFEHDDVGLYRLRVDDSGHRLREGIGQPAGARVVVGHPLDVVVQRVVPGRGEHADLAHPAAEPLAPPGPPRCARRRHDQRADGRSETLGQADRHGVEELAVGRQRGPVATCAFQSRAPSRCIRTPAVAGDLAQPPDWSSGCTVPPPKLCVFSTTTAPVDTRCGPASGRISAGDRRGRVARGPRERRVVMPETAAAARARPVRRGRESSQSSSWPGRASSRTPSRLASEPVGGEQRRLVPEQRGDPALELGDRRVLAVDVVADLRRRHRGPHRRASAG